MTRRRRLLAVLVLAAAAGSMVTVEPPEPVLADHPPRTGYVWSTDGWRATEVAHDAVYEHENAWVCGRSSGCQHDDIDAVRDDGTVVPAGAAVRGDTGESFCKVGSADIDVGCGHKAKGGWRPAVPVHPHSANTLLDAAYTDWRCSGPGGTTKEGEDTAHDCGDWVPDCDRFYQGAGTTDHYHANAAGSEHSDCAEHKADRTVCPSWSAGHGHTPVDNSALPVCAPDDDPEPEPTTPPTTEPPTTTEPPPPTTQPCPAGQHRQGLACVNTPPPPPTQPSRCPPSGFDWSGGFRGYVQRLIPYARRLGIVPDASGERLTWANPSVSPDRIDARVGSDAVPAAVNIGIDRPRHVYNFGTNCGTVVSDLIKVEIGFTGGGSPTLARPAAPNPAGTPRTVCDAKDDRPTSRRPWTTVTTYGDWWKRCTGALTLAFATTPAKGAKITVTATWRVIAHRLGSAENPPACSRDYTGWHNCVQVKTTSSSGIGPGPCDGHASAAEIKDRLACLANPPIPAAGGSRSSPIWHKKWLPGREAGTVVLEGRAYNPEIGRKSANVRIFLPPADKWAAAANPAIPVPNTIGSHECGSAEYHRC